MKALNNLIYIVLMALFLIGDVHSEGGIELYSKVDRSKITIGDLVTYTIIIKRDKGVEVKLPVLGANLGQFEIRDYKIHNQQIEDDKIIDRIDYIISTFDVGEYEIPPVEIKYKLSKEKEERVLKTDKINIVVESVKPSEAGDIKEIKPPVDIPYNWKPEVLWTSVGIGTFLVIFLCWYIFKKRKKLKDMLSYQTEPMQPAEEIAYERLRKLAESDLLLNGLIKEYYMEISQIIRQYVEGRYKIIAMELTTTDLLNSMIDDGILSEHIIMFEEFLNKCDLVKFAKYVPTISENDYIMKLAIDIVDRTRIKQEQELIKNNKGSQNEGGIVGMQISDEHAEQQDQHIEDNSLR